MEFSMCISRGFLACATAAVALTLVNAGDAKATFGDPVRCKFGRNGVFKSAAEYKIFVYHQQVDEFKYFDKNCDGVISPNERAAYLAALDQEFGKGAEHEFRRNTGANLPIQVPK